MLLGVFSLLTEYSKQRTVDEGFKQAADTFGFTTVRFGDRIRELRTAKKLTQRNLGAEGGVEFRYISKIENGKLDFGEYPSGWQEAG